MFKNRFLVVLGIVSILLVSLAVSSFRANASLSNREAANDFYQRHPNWSWSVSAPAADYSDYFQRHPELVQPMIRERDTSDYFLRHPELSVQASSPVDLTDYYFRHIND